MTTTKNTQPVTPSRKPLAEYKDATVTPLIQEYADWLTANTGVKVDPLSVFLGSALRSRFQQERREAKPAIKAKKAAPKKEATKAPAKAKTTKPAPATATKESK